MTDLVMMDATALSAAIRTKRVSCVEVMQATLAHIARLNPAVNAIIDLRDGDALMAEARERDDDIARGLYRGALHGLPQAIKNLEPVKGMRMTMGSPLLKDFVPPADSIMVERMRNAGAVFVGRTNTPEFGLGSHTYNPVHGRTRNAYDQTRSAGGSSGGAAVAVALRMLPVADGSDYGGSLRNPAGWNNIFALRPSIGRVPSTTARRLDADDGACSAPWRATCPTSRCCSKSKRDSIPARRLSLDGKLDLAGLARRRHEGQTHRLGRRLRRPPSVRAGRAGSLPRSAENLRRAWAASSKKRRPTIPLEKVWRAFLGLRAWQGGSAILALLRRSEAARALETRSDLRNRKRRKAHGLRPRRRLDGAHALVRGGAQTLRALRLFRRCRRRSCSPSMSSGIGRRKSPAARWKPITSG